MSKILTDNKYYGQIADVIREQNGTSNTYKPQQIVTALKDLFYEEVEGVPPITYNGIGENLLDYRIDGASGGVGDRTKNLLQNTATSRTINGVTFTVNNDGSVTCNGTPNSGIYSDLPLSGTPYGEKLIVEYGNYIFSSIGSSSALAAIIGNGTHEIGRARGNDVTFTDDVSWVLLRCYGVEEPQTVYPMIRLASIEDDTYEPYGYKVPVVVSGKNLFDEIYPNIEINTVKYISFALTNGEYTLSSNIPNGGSASLFLLAGQVNSGASTQDNGVWLNNPQTVNVIDGFLTIGYRIYGNMNPEDYETILALGSTATDYEPYHEPTTTNIYLDEPIEENESISLSDTNVSIPTIRGTNILSVDTTVQPSNVYVKSRKESSYEIAMRERYEEAQAQLDALESGGE